MSKEYKIEIWQKEMQILKERLKDFGKFRENDLKEIEKLTKMTQVQKEKIADLEAKLAEKDKKIEKLEQGLKDTIKIYSDEFVVKDKRIKELNFEAQKYYEDAYCNDFHTQDKILFAVEQLEKVKEYIKESLEYMWNGNAEMTYRDRNIIDGIYSKLAEQIAELTHQQEDKGE